MRKPNEIETEFAPRAALEACRSLYLLGIMGAGMRGLVPHALRSGFAVAGVDTQGPEGVSSFEAFGVTVKKGHSREIPEGVDGLVLTDAVDLATSPEVATARRRGIPLFRRSQLLGWLVRNHRVIAVTGTHGKTTTTGLIGSGLIGAGFEPCVIVGASIPQWGSSEHHEDGEWAVVEACEAYNGMLDLDPEIVVLTNLELDHADFHGSYSSLRDSMVRFVRKIPERGCLIYAEENPGAAEVAALSGVRSIGYGATRDLNLALPGEHNRLNAGAAVAVLKFLEVGDRMANGVSGIEGFSGAERRLQVLLDDDVAVVDDYAHHPSEIEASLAAIREKFPNRPVVVVFQPHLYSRTKEFLAEFGQALSRADRVVLTDVYPAREAPIPGVSSAVLAEHISAPVRYVPSRWLLPRKVREGLHSGDVVVGMGAGTIDAFAPALIEELKQRPLAGLCRPIRVAVLYAGDSSEREVSILSGREIYAALLRLGHEAHLLDVTELLHGGGNLSAFAGAARPDLAFLAVHGTHAEDGAIQGLLELLHIPYTGSGIQASALAMDKAMTKAIFAVNGIRVPQGQVVTSLDDHVSLPLPLVVKPNAEGSTVGVSFVRAADELCPAIAKGLSYGPSVIVEELIEGMEVSTPVLSGKPLLPVEIAPLQGNYDFANKYTPGATDEIIPARLSPDLLAECQRVALRAHELLGCRGATRTDMMVRGREIFVLEINTLPGMTKTSLLPNSAAAGGITFDALCQTLLEGALPANTHQPSQPLRSDGS